MLLLFGRPSFNAPNFALSLYHTNAWDTPMHVRTQTHMQGMKGANH